MKNKIQLGKIVGTGGLGVLVAGLIASSLLDLGLEYILGISLVIYVTAGAVALMMRNI